MLEMYKLRLRDGTVLVVDHAALSTWLVDGKAMVQPVGSERWLPLRQFLAKEKAEAASAARRSPPIPDEIPVARQPPLPSERSLPPVDPPPLPAVEPPPLPPASEGPVWSSPPPVFTSEPPVVWAPPEEITVQPPAADDAVSIADMPSADEPEAPLFTDVPSPSEPPAPLLSVSEAPEVWAPAEEAAAIDEAAGQPPTPDDEVEVEVAALPEADEPEAPPFIDVPSPSHPPADLPSISLTPEVWAPTEEAAALYEATAAELYESTARPPARGDEDALWRTAAQAMNEARETPASFKPRNLQVLAEATSRARSKPPPSTSRDGLIALKPLDDEEEASRRAAAQPILYEGDEEAERATGLESSFLGLAPPWDARLSRWLDVLSTWVARLGRGLDRLTPRDPASTARASLSRLRGLASLWTDRSSKWMERLTRRNVQAPLPPSGEAPRGAATPSPVLRKPAMPPPPLSELPVLRFAKTDDTEAEGAEDHDVYQGAPSFDVVWLWLKRIALITVLVAGGVVAASTWEAWLPAATQLGRAFFLEIHEREHPRAPSGEEPRPAPVRELLPALAEQLPHLAPETIALVMARSPATVLDGPEVFARAYDATERGLTALSAPEAQELGALQRALLNTLLPAERQRVREYDLVRARRAPLPTENRDVLRSFAHGARALPSWVRERLQELSGKAIAAGLALPSDASPRAATAP